MSGASLPGSAKSEGDQALSDADLVRRAQAGEADAVAEIYRQHVQGVFHYIVARVGDAQIAEDLTSEVFVRMIEALDRYEPRGAPLEAWLYRIARDRVGDHFRLQARHPAAPLDEGAVDLDSSPEAETMRRRLYERLRAQLAHLTDDQRDVIHFRFLEDLSLERTAGIMGRSVGAIKALQHRALQALARMMNEDG